MENRSLVTRKWGIGVDPNALEGNLQQGRLCAIERQAGTMV
jgi:hypothetical protein